MAEGPIINRHGDAGFDATGTLVIPPMHDLNSNRPTIDGMDLLNRIVDFLGGSTAEETVAHDIRITVERIGDE